MGRALATGILSALLIGAIGGVVAYQLWAASRKTIEARFAANSEATSSILFTALTEQAIQVDAVARALEVSFRQTN